MAVKWIGNRRVEVADEESVAVAKPSPKYKIEATAEVVESPKPEKEKE
jgi:hypothetical protein